MTRPLPEGAPTRCIWCPNEYPFRSNKKYCSRECQVHGYNELKIFRRWNVR